jgi:putative transposase
VLGSAVLGQPRVRDALIACCDGLTGFPKAIEVTWPQSIVQTCTVHLLRAAMRFVSYADRKKVAGRCPERAVAGVRGVGRTRCPAPGSGSAGCSPT